MRRVCLTILISCVSLSSYADSSKNLVEVFGQQLKPCSISFNQIEELSKDKEFGWVGPFGWVFDNMTNPGYQNSKGNLSFDKSYIDLNQDGSCEIIAFPNFVQKDGDGGPIGIVVPKLIYQLQNTKYMKIGSFKSYKSLLGVEENGFLQIISNVTDNNVDKSKVRAIEIYAFEEANYTKKTSAQITPKQASNLGFR